MHSGLCFEIFCTELTHQNSGKCREGVLVSTARACSMLLKFCMERLLNERNLSWENESMHEMPSFGLLEFRPMSDIVERLHRPLLTIISYIHTLSWRSFGLYTRVGDWCSPLLPILTSRTGPRFRRHHPPPQLGFDPSSADTTVS